VCLELGEIKAILRRKEKHGDGSLKTYILQQYIERPLLYRRRKFDLRHYLMLTCVNGCLKGYWYRHGYVRTTSSEYSLSGTAPAVHLTNDAVQKTLPDYGRFEKGNKITYDDLDAFLRQKDPAFDFRTVVYPQMRATAVSAIRASAVSLDPQRRSNNFEVFGLDFMIDADYRVWLIEVNTNPCLETTCPVLSAIIPAFLEHAFQYLPPHAGSPSTPSSPPRSPSPPPSRTTTPTSQTTTPSNWSSTNVSTAPVGLALILPPRTTKRRCSTTTAQTSRTEFLSLFFITSFPQADG
jgi:hypothetical protein